MNKWALILIILLILIGANYFYSGISGKTIIENIKESMAKNPNGVSGKVIEGAEEKNRPIRREFGVNITVLPS